MRVQSVGWWIFVFALMLQGVDRAEAHSRPFTTVTLNLEGDRIFGRLEIRGKDARALSLDKDRDGTISPAELTAGKGQVYDYFQRGLSLNVHGTPCRLGFEGELTKDAEHDLLVVPISYGCPPPVDEIFFEYKLFFDSDRDHIGMVVIERGEQSELSLFSREQPTYLWKARQGAFAGTLWQFLKEGVWHILSGLDHLLFLFVLLLAAPLVRMHEGAKRREELRSVLWETAKIVTAFTVAHSLTLTIVCMGAISFPERLVEVGIAISIAMAAAMNLGPRPIGRRWLVAFGFGLVHGLGFATMLREMVGSSSVMPALLLAFNVGVELGQLAVVAVVVPLLYVASRQYWYARICLRGGSWAALGVALVWAVDRATGWGFMPG